MKVALAQIKTPAGDFEATYEVMYSWAKRAQDEGAKLVVFPAPALMGPDPMANLDNPAYRADAYAVLEHLAKTIDIDAFVPYLSGHFGNPVPSVAFLHDGKVECSQSDYVRRFEVDEALFGLAFNAPELKQLYESDDVDAICFLPFAAYSGDSSFLSSLVASAFYGNSVEDAPDANPYLLALTTNGAYEDYVYIGGSFAMKPLGNIVNSLSYFTEDLLVLELKPGDEDAALEVDESTSTSEARETFLYAEDFEYVNEKPEIFTRDRMLWRAASLALHDYVEVQKFDGVCLVLDGSVASSITAALAVDALGPSRVHALVFAHDSTEEQADSRNLAHELDIDVFDEVSPANLERMLAPLGFESQGNKALLKSFVDIRLAAHANSSKLLVLSAADKTGLLLGEYQFVGGTLSYAPFGDIYRSDMLTLVKWRLDEYYQKTKRILFSLNAHAHSSEFIEWMSDHETADIAPGTVDAILLCYLEHGSDSNKLIEVAKGNKNLVQSIYNRLHETVLSRQFMPNFPVLSSCSVNEIATPATDAWINTVDERPQNTFPSNQDQFDIRHSSGMYISDELDSLLKSLPLSDQGELDLDSLLSSLTASGASIQAVPLSASYTFSGKEDESPEEIRSHVSEMFGLLHELSQTSKMKKKKDKNQDPGSSWLSSMFSDN